MIRSFLIGLFLSFAILGSTQDKKTSCNWNGKDRELRYHPDGEDFVITNGNKRFTRAIYGTNTGFRFETSDFPEFGLYMPGLGGSIYLALSKSDSTIWIKDVESVESRFRSGERKYIIKDKNILGGGVLTIDAVSLSDCDGLIVKFEADNIPSGVKLLWIYGGANNTNLQKDGDLGFSTDDFIIKPENCEGNIFDLTGSKFTLSYDNNKRKIVGLFPEDTKLRLTDGTNINSLSKLVTSTSTSRPVLLGEHNLNTGSFYFEIHNSNTRESFKSTELPNAFEAGIELRKNVASHLKINTPDQFLNTLGGIFAGAEDAIWENPSYLHGAIGWRTPLTGWRGAYIGDLLGLHDRARTHFNGYLNSQVTDVPTILPPTQDENLNLARPAKIWGTPMYSNGYICRSPNNNHQMHHYDMNLVFVDELLWHLNWTGDIDYARKIFPLLQRHLAWEKKAFDPDNDGLYDALCCIWASDALQYNGGKVTYSSAYNYRANKLTAEIAKKIGEDTRPYAEEAERILTGIDRELWVKDKGYWAEFVDNMGNGMRHEHAAVWSIYHSVDSDIHDPFKACEATRYIDTQIPHIPVLAKGLTDTSNYVISTSDWQPYIWSVNNVAFAEIAHTSLAYWQSGRYNEALKMFKGAVLDAMYLGSGPGNITQISYYDAAWGEAYRDFSDPVGIGARAIVQGMFGINPDLMNNRLVIRPGFPEAWDFAEIETKNMAYSFKRDGSTERYLIQPNLMKKNFNLVMEVNAHANKVSSILVNGKEVSYTLLNNAVSIPKIIIEAGNSPRYEVVIKWAGKKIEAKEISVEIANGDELKLNLPTGSIDVFDPQGVLLNRNIKQEVLHGKISGTEGHRTLFVNVISGDMKYWAPINISILKPVEIIDNPDSETLRFTLVNNRESAVSGKLFLNGRDSGKMVNIPKKGRLEFSFSLPEATLGTNKIEIRSDNRTYTFKAINWNIANSSKVNYQTIDLNGTFNEKVRDIFGYGKYVSPRYPFTTLQIPTQGIGEWCHPSLLLKIDDRGLREIAAKENNVFTMPQGIPFATSGRNDDNNVAFTSKWDNYPDSITVPLKGKASKAYFLIAGSTNHMQSNILNGQVRVRYKDGSEDVLDLILPDNLLPIEQDLYNDGWAFKNPQPRPWRVRLKTGEVSKYHAGKVGEELSKIGKIYVESGMATYVDGGMATMLDLPLDPGKELNSLTLETKANEVVIGLMAITLMK